MTNTITTEEIIVELKRELGMRKNVYSRHVEAGTLRPSVAEKRIAIMELLLHEKEVALAEEAKRVQPSLF